jgi:DNA-binding MarR family transcriptional regulator
MARKVPSTAHDRSKYRRDGGRADLERASLLAARTLVDRMRALYRELERMTGAPITMHRALTCIGEEPGITASKLAESLGMQRPAVSHVLRGLTEHGWIERERHAADQRSVRLHVTPRGQLILDATGGRAVGTLQRCVRQLTRAQLAGLTSGLEALLGHLPPPLPTQHVRPYRRTLSVGRK